MNFQLRPEVLFAAGALAPLLDSNSSLVKLLKPFVCVAPVGIGAKWSGH